MATNVYVQRKRIQNESVLSRGSSSVSSGSGLHWEVFSTNDLSSTDLLTGRTLTVVFKTPFFGVPVGVNSIKLWRVEEQDGMWIITDVVNHRLSANWINDEGFVLEISQYEDLAGINFEYAITEYIAPES